MTKSFNMDLTTSRCDNSRSSPLKSSTNASTPQKPQLSQNSRRLYTSSFRFSVLMLLFYLTCTHVNAHRLVRTRLAMKWSFAGMGDMGGIMGGRMPGMPGRMGGRPSLADVGVVGSEGELYFHAQKPAKLKAQDPSCLGKSRVVPLYPSQGILLPQGTETLNVFEMKHRQLLNDVGDGLFGYIHVSQQQQKLALVGTLARIKSRKLMDDGRSAVVVEGVERFYIQEIVGEQPYFKAKIQPFSDYSETPDFPSRIEQLEEQVFAEVRTNVKLMQLLFPEKNYTMNANILLNRPPLSMGNNIRAVKFANAKEELKRRERLSFAVMDMLQLPPATKLKLLQEHVVENRFSRLLKVLVKGGGYLRQELKKRLVMSDEGIRQICQEVLDDSEALVPLTDKDWIPENYNNESGSWKQMPVLF